MFFRSLSLSLFLSVSSFCYLLLLLFFFCSKIFLVCQIARAKIILANIKEAKQRSLFDCRFQLFYLSLLWIVFDRRFCTFWRVEDRDSKITLFVPKPHSSLSGEHSKKNKKTVIIGCVIFILDKYEKKKKYAPISNVIEWINFLTPFLLLYSTT